MRKIEMAVKIELFSDFQLKTEDHKPLVLVLPRIEFARSGDNIPYIYRIIHDVEGTPKELAAEIKKVYKDLEAEKELKPLKYIIRLEQGSCTLNQPLIQPVNCTLQVVVEYFDSDATGNVLLSEPRRIEKKCYLRSDLFLGLKAKLSALTANISTRTSIKSIFVSIGTTRKTCNRF